MEEEGGERPDNSGIIGGCCQAPFELLIARLSAGRQKRDTRTRAELRCLSRYRAINDKIDQREYLALFLLLSSSSFLVSEHEEYSRPTRRRGCESGADSKWRFAIRPACRCG